MTNKSQVRKHWVNPPACGTKGGYDVHRRMHAEEPCDDCRQAMRQYWRDFNEKYKGRKYEQRKVLEQEKPYFYRNQRSRARKMQVPFAYYREQEVLDLYGTDCHICGEPVDLSAPRAVGRPGWEKGLHIDHVHPLAKGGHDTLENVRPAHGQCNIIKSDTFEES